MMVVVEAVGEMEVTEVAEAEICLHILEINQSPAKFQAVSHTLINWALRSAAVNRINFKKKSRLQS